MSHLWGVALATLAAVLLRLFHLSEQSLWVDEVVTWHNAGIGVDLTLKYIFQNDHGPLQQVILHNLGILFGDSEFVLRIPSAVVGVALVPVMAGLAGAILGPRAIAPTAWLCALSPFLVWYGQEVRNYSFAMLFATSAAWAAVRWRDGGGLAWAVLFVLSCWFGLLSNLSVVLVLPVLFLYVALPHGGTRGRPLAALVAGSALIALESPWLVEYAQRLAWSRLMPAREVIPGEAPLRGATTFTLGAYPFTFSSFSVGYTLGPSLHELHVASPWRVALGYWHLLVPAAIVFALLTLRGIAALIRSPYRLLFVVGLILLPLLGVTYAAVQNYKVFNPRYVSAGISGFYLLLVAGWLAFGPRLRAWVTLAVLLLWGVSLWNYYFVERYGKEDYRSATFWLAERVSPDDQLIASANYAPLDYYWRDRQPAYEHYWIGHTHDPEVMAAKFLAMEDSTRVTWVVISRSSLEDPEGRLDRYLIEERGAEADHFPGVRIYRLEPTRPERNEGSAKGDRAALPPAASPWPGGVSGNVAPMQRRQPIG
jgi:uncharacterized membrane protein